MFDTLAQYAHLRAENSQDVGPFVAVTVDVAGVLVLPEPSAVLSDARSEEQWDSLVYCLSVQTDTTYDQTDWAFLARSVGTSVARVKRYVHRLHALHTSTSIWRAAPGAQSFLRDLRRVGMPLAVISNTARPMALQVLDRLGMVGVHGVEENLVFDSSVVGVAKPDRGIFRLAFDRLDVSPMSVLHIGDSLTDDVAGALGVGAFPLHMRPYGACDSVDHFDIREFPLVVSTK